MIVSSLTARGELPWKFFHPPGKMCWSKFTTIGHSLKNFPPHAENSSPLGVPSWLHARWQLDTGSRLASYENFPQHPTAIVQMKIKFFDNETTRNT